MTHDDALARALRGLDAPVDPEPAFVEQLYRLASAELEHRPRTAAASPAERTPAPIRIDRRQGGRWMQVAAVAVLLVSMIGGIARVSTGDDPTPTIQAPETRPQAVMLGGTAAQDNQFSGPAPTAEAYERLWSFEVPDGYLHWPVLAFGDRIFGISESRSAPGRLIMNAFAAQSGERLWSREIGSGVRFVVTERGIVVALPLETDPEREASGLPARVRVALLDLATGDPIWTSEQIYGALPQYSGSAAIVDGDNIYFTDSDGMVFSLDLETGRERWRFAYERACSADVPSPDSCTRRFGFVPALAARGDLVYIADLVPATVIALSAEEGAERWRAPMIERAGDKTTLGQVMAVDGGVVVQLLEPLAPTFDQQSYLGFWSADDGAEVWSTTEKTGGLASDGSTLFVTFTPAVGPCCEVGRIDIRSGRTLTRRPIEGGMVVGYIRAGNALVIQEMRSEPLSAALRFSWSGLNATSLRETWRFDHPDGACQPSFPALDSGNLVCVGGPLSVYKPVSPAATPAATPAANEDLGAVGWSAAGDGTWPGVAPAAGEYRLLWSGQGPEFGRVAPYQGKLYELVSRLGESSAQGIAAYDAATGAELWYQPVAANFSFAVTGAGVVVGIPDSFGTGASPAADGSIWAFHVALLDLETGQPIWRSAETYQLPGSLLSSSLNIAGGAALFVEQDLTLVAIDLATGQERWRVESNAAPRIACERAGAQPPCFHAGPVVSGDMVYFDNPAAGNLVAISLRTGEQVWSVNDPLGPAAESSNGLPVARAIRLAAVEQGVLVNTWPPTGSAGTFGLWSAADGSPVWTWGERKGVQDLAVIGDSVIVITRDVEDETFRLERVDLATGEVLETLARLSSEHVSLRYLPEDQMLLVGTWAGDQGSFWLDLEAMEVSQRGPTVEQCPLPRFPVMPDGSVACSRGSGLAVYAPVPSSGTPTPASGGQSISPPVGSGEELVTTVADVALRAAPGENAALWLGIPEAGTRLEFIGDVGIDAEANVWYRVRSPETAIVGYVPAEQVAPAE